MRPDKPDKRYARGSRRVHRARDSACTLSSTAVAGSLLVERAGRFRGQISRMMVNGPSLTLATAIIAPKTPVWTSAPRRLSSLTTSRTRGSA